MNTSTQSAPAVDPTAGGPRSALVVNTNRVEDADVLRTRIEERVAAAGWPAPAWFETSAEDPGKGQAEQAVADGAEVVIVCGGDGTVRSAIEGLVGTDAALAILPGGTGNLLAANLGIPTDLDDALEVVLTGSRRTIDVGEIEGQAFAIMAGMGFDAQVMSAAPTALKARAGWLAYVVGAFKHLAEREMHVQIRLDDDEPITRHARTVLVGNVGRLQGGLVLMPDAQAANGSLDVAVVAPRNIGHWLQLVVGVALRRERVPRRELFRAERVRVRSDRPQPRQVDGDLIDDGRTLDVRVRPGCLNICVPAEA
ncbi:diacylglycerol kinase [Cellulomonas sp. DKR-3]|uniref:Diacylglycerol kinase n=1 Tax=Cellulomonas fulva TaxID=2835530 RepID=A0ABS5TXZ6_9CELL|nr:diacylglycerol kinase family protein [Cellulomonas fulva]MBT0994020.1 diacylglycerol kinase [Cellulomonas fulva]